MVLAIIDLILLTLWQLIDPLMPFWSEVSFTVSPAKLHVYVIFKVKKKKNTTKYRLILLFDHFKLHLGELTHFDPILCYKVYFKLHNH